MSKMPIKWWLGN